MLKNKIIYLLLAGYSVVFSVLYNQYVSALIAVVLIALPVVLLAILIYTTCCVTVELSTKGTVTRKGECVEVLFLVKNKSHFPVAFSSLYIGYYNRFTNTMEKEKITLFIDKKSEKKISCKLTMNHCGNIIVACESIRIYDYLKIFSIKKSIKKKVKIATLPELYEIKAEFKGNSIGVISESTVFSKTKAGDDPSEVFAIREYQQGDKLQRIHWKLTSKKEEVMVKDFSLSMDCSINVLVNLYFCGEKSEIYSFMDAMLETVYSLSYALILGGFWHNIIWYDGTRDEYIKVMIEDEEQLYEVMIQLLERKGCQDNDVFLQNYDRLYGMDDVADIFYVTGSVSEEALELLHNHNHNQTQLHVLYTGNQGEKIEIPRGKITMIYKDNVKGSLEEVEFR